MASNDGICCCLLLLLLLQTFHHFRAKIGLAFWWSLLWEPFERAILGSLLVEPFVGAFWGAFLGAFWGSLLGKPFVRALGEACLPGLPGHPAFFKEQLGRALLKRNLEQPF